MADSANLESRRDLFTLLASLPAPQLEEVIFALAPPAGIMPSGTAPQGERVAALLQWVESPTGCGLAALAALAKEYRAEWEAIDAEAVEIATRPKLIIQTVQRADRQCFAERLPGLEAAPTESLLKLVQLPGGAFWMGSAEDELDRYDDEGPQHQVTVPAFFMGMTPITQIQWRAVAQLPTINRTLAPEPSHFKGDHHPVEQVNWPEAMEFCGRLSEYSGRDYRLPTEAEWEYACRADTTSPFHCGETITTDLANYRGTDNKEYGWSGSYGRGPKGEYRETTTEVGIFPANGFGLYDMHGMSGNGA